MVDQNVDDLKLVWLILVAAEVLRVVVVCKLLLVHNLIVHLQVNGPRAPAVDLVDFNRHTQLIVVGEVLLAGGNGDVLEDLVPSEDLEQAAMRDPLLQHFGCGEIKCV